MNKNQLILTFNGEDYVASYNKQSGYYEIELTAPNKGGIYNADITFTDIFEKQYKDIQPIQIWAKEEIKIETNKVFMWIFDYKDFSVKDIVEIADYEINIDEEGKLVTFDIVNDIKQGIVLFSKTDVSSGEILEGAKIEIVGVSDTNNNIKVEFISSKNGNKFRLPIGKYEIREIVAPNGYILPIIKKIQ